MKTIYDQPLRTCQIAPCGNTAKYDAPTTSGQWAYMCESCYIACAAQYANRCAYILSTDPEPERTYEDIRSDIMAAIDSNDADAVWDLVGDGDLLDYI